MKAATGQRVLWFSARTSPPASSVVYFNRKELNAILQAYGRGVVGGDWRDYTIDHLRDVAVFSIFRYAREGPLYRIEKRLKPMVRQGAYSIIAPTGLILKRGHELDNVLRLFNRGKLSLVEART